MHAPPRSFIPEVFRQHTDDIGFLWGQRQSALRSPDFTAAELFEVEARIEAHLDGVQAASAASVRILESGLTADDPLAVFAAAYSLLRFHGGTSTAGVLEALRMAEGERLCRLGEAFSHAPMNGSGSIQRLSSLLNVDDAVVAGTAAEILAFHGALRLTAEQHRRFLAHEDSRVRLMGWRLAAMLTSSLDAKLYATAMRDDDAKVRSAALEAGAWSGMQGVLIAARTMAREPKPESMPGLLLLAVLGSPDELPSLADVGRDESLGPERYRVLGAAGHPDLVDVILTGLADSDPAAAACAGAAFTKLTGVEVESGSTATVSSKNEHEAAESAAALPNEVMLPDPNLARRAWDEMKPQLGAAPRICRGHDMSRPLDQAAFDSLDMESRWETFLRSKFYGSWDGSPLSLEVFPQRR